jgi:hypothetical protein
MQLLLLRILASRNANACSPRICSIKDRSYNFHVFARRWSGVEKIEPLVNISAIVAQLLVFNKHYIMNTFTIEKNKVGIIYIYIYSCLFVHLIFIKSVLVVRSLFVYPKDDLFHRRSYYWIGYPQRWVSIVKYLIDSRMYRIEKEMCYFILTKSFRKIVCSLITNFIPFKVQRSKCLYEILSG